MSGCVSESRGSAGPLVREIQVLLLHKEALVVLKTLQCREATQTDRKPGDFQFTGRACLWPSEFIRSTSIL